MWTFGAKAGGPEDQVGAGQSSREWYHCPRWANPRRRRGTCCSSHVTVQSTGSTSLPTWIKTLAKTFRHDYEAVKAALTTPSSTAQVEGQNTRVKLIKRLGYGRAKLDLLNARILHRAAA